MGMVVQILCIVMMVWYLIPVFTAHVLNSGNVCGILLFMLIYSYARHFHQVNRFLILKHAKLGMLVLALSLVICVMLISSAMAIAQTSKRPGKEGTVVVLGCKVGSQLAQSRIDTAVAYMKDHPEAYVVVTGGTGRDEYMSEAEYMRRQMVYEGVDSAHIVMEQEARNTYENMKNTSILLGEKNLNEHIIIVSNDFHLYRSDYYAKKNHLTYDNLAAPTPWYLLPTYFTREMIAVLHIWLS